MTREKRAAVPLACFMVGATLLAMPTFATAPAAALAEDGTPETVVERLQRMPLLFVPEQVSADGAMGYAVRGNEASVWLSASGLSYRLHPATGADPGRTAAAGSWLSIWSAPRHGRRSARTCCRPG